MKVKTSTLTGPALDWAAAKAEYTDGRIVRAEKNWRGDTGLVFVGIRPETEQVFRFMPTETPGQAWPIIEREGIHTRPGNDLYFPKGNEKGEHYEALWLASIKNGDVFHGQTSLIAAMRCYVAFKLGDEVDIPEELT